MSKSNNYLMLDNLNLINLLDMIYKKTVRKLPITLFYIIISFIFFPSCGNHEFELPENVEQILEKAGDNRSELEKVITHYKETGEVIKEEAAYFLIGNMGKHGYLKYKLVDTAEMLVGFNVLDFPDYNSMVEAWDKVEEDKGEINYKSDTLILDCQVIDADFLIQNIDLAHKAWEEFPWASKRTFDDFCEYILPYRGSNEPLEEWRSYFMEKYSWVKDSLKDPNDPVEAAILINNDIKSWFHFDPRFYRHPTDQGLFEMKENKLGRCEDMTNLAIYAMRAMGIAVMSDFTPYWANSGNNHAWNALLDKNDSVIIFMGGESNPGDYSLGNKLAKVYRKTYSVQESSLAEVKEEWEKAPPYLGSNTIKDVTVDYISTARPKINLDNDIPDSTNFAYLCVFNSGEWKAIAPKRIRGGKAAFSEIGQGIAYLPAFYYDKEIIPAADAFILSDSGNVDYKIPDVKNRITITLHSTTRKITKEATDFTEKSFFNKGEIYTLNYWDKKWIEIGKQKAGGNPLIFENVPSNAIYWLTGEGSRNEERIFTIDDEGGQVWW